MNDVRYYNEQREKEIKEIDEQVKKDRREKIEKILYFDNWLKTIPRC